MRTSIRPVTALLAAIALVGGLSGCATARQECALIGGGLGTAVGIGVGVVDELDGAEIAATAGAGLVIGAAAGYTYCVLTDWSD